MRAVRPGLVVPDLPLTIGSGDTGTGGGGDGMPPDSSDIPSGGGSDPSPDPIVPVIPPVRPGSGSTPHAGSTPRPDPIDMGSGSGSGTPPVPEPGTGGGGRPDQGSTPITPEPGTGGGIIPDPGSTPITPEPGTGAGIRPDPGTGGEGVIPDPTIEPPTTGGGGVTPDPGLGTDPTFPPGCGRTEPPITNPGPPIDPNPNLPMDPSPPTTPIDPNPNPPIDPNPNPNPPIDPTPPRTEPNPGTLSRPNPDTRPVEPVPPTTNPGTGSSRVQPNAEEGGVPSGGRTNTTPEGGNPRGETQQQDPTTPISRIIDDPQQNPSTGADLMDSVVNDGPLPSERNGNNDASNSRNNNNSTNDQMKLMDSVVHDKSGDAGGGNEVAKNTEPLKGERTKGTNLLTDVIDDTVKTPGGDDQEADALTNPENPDDKTVRLQSTIGDNTRPLTADDDKGENDIDAFKLQSAPPEPSGDQNDEPPLTEIISGPGSSVQEDGADANSRKGVPTVETDPTTAAEANGAGGNTVLTARLALVGVPPQWNRNLTTNSSVTTGLRNLKHPAALCGGATGDECLVRSLAVMTIADGLGGMGPEGGRGVGRLRWALGAPA